MTDTKTILAAAGFGLGAYLLWPRKKAMADQPPGEPDEPVAPVHPDPTSDDPFKPVVPVQPDPTSDDPFKPKPGGLPKIYPLVKWDSPSGSEGHGIPMAGSKIVGQGSAKDGDVTYFEWRLRKTVITFTCVDDLAICQYVVETRGVRSSVWDTLKSSQVTTKKNTSGWSYDSPTHVVLEDLRILHLEDYEKEKGLFG